MTEIITDAWINSKDLIDAGEETLMDLGSQIRSTTRHMRSVKKLYSDLMRTTNLPEVQQVAALAAAQTELAELAGSITEMLTKMAMTAADIETNYAAAIQALLPVPEYPE